MTKHLLSLVVIHVCRRVAGQPPPRPPAAPQTMRVDYYHTGNAKEERFSLDRIVIEPLPWPGNPARPIDDTNRGKYFFEVVDAASGAVLYSRGFSSIYGEWETTGEAKEIDRTFSESLRFPGARQAGAHRRQEARRAGTCSATSGRIDGRSRRQVRRARRRAPDAGPLIKLHESGDPATKLDLLILGDGYTARERGKFERDARRLVATLLATSPFKERQRDINIWGLSPAGGAVGHLAAVAAHLPAVAGRRHLRRVRFRALRADVREQGVPRHRRERAVRRRRDPDEQRDLRRRRHLRSVQHRRGRQRLGAVHLRARVRPSHRRPGRRVLHVRRRLPAGGRSRRAVGAERDGAARSGDAEMEGPRDAGRRRCRRRGRKRSSSATRRRFSRSAARSAPRTGRKRRWTRCSATRRSATRRC